MRVAIACDGLKVSPSVNRCTSFMCYTIDKGVITSLHNLPNRTTDSYDLANIICDLQFDALIAGEIDPRIREALQSCDIDFISDVSGDANEVIKHYLNDNLLKLVYTRHSNDEFDGGEDEASDREMLDRLAEDIIKEVS